MKQIIFLDRDFETPFLELLDYLHNKNIELEEITLSYPLETKSGVKPTSIYGVKVNVK